VALGAAVTLRLIARHTSRAQSRTARVFRILQQRVRTALSATDILIGWRKT
jgi:hypothetical protein